MLTLLTVTVQADQAVPILGRAVSGAAGFVVVNVGGLDLTKATTGPDDAWLFEDNGLQPPRAFLLLSGASLALPGDLSNLYAAAVNSATTLSVALGSR